MSSAGQIMKRIRIGACAFLITLSGVVAARGDIRIEVEGKLPPAAERAVAELREIAAAKPASSKKAAVVRTIVVGLNGHEGPIAAALKKADLTLVAAPEALAVARVSDQKLVVAGHDARGLAYAVRDIARAVELN